MGGKIRLVTPNDTAAIQAIYAPYVNETTISFELTPPTVDEMGTRIQKTLAKYPWLVYELDSIATGPEAATQPTIAGYVYASSHRERSAYQWSVDVSVYIDPRYHRRHIGRGLYTALFDLLREQGYVNAYAGIALPNAGSVGIHTSLGFKPVGIYQHVGYKLGGWHDVGWWVLHLAEPATQPLPPRPITDFVNTPILANAFEHGLSLIQPTPSTSTNL